jgi:outer membrane protein, heavy metal efflux system
MIDTRQFVIPLSLLVALTSTGMYATAQDGQPIPLRETITKTVPAGPGLVGPLTLPDVEQKAIQTNPTIDQARSNIEAARARARQAGLLPNPVVGGELENFAFRWLDKKPTYLGFFVQTIPLGGKLSKMRNIYRAEATQAEIETEMQKMRVANTARVLFYQTLGAQQILDQQTELAAIARDATTTTSELFNVGQADKPDYIESVIEKEQVEHDLVAARNNYLRAWRILAVFLGSPDGEPVRLAGSLEERVGPINEQQIYQRLIQESPQMRAAQAQIQRARAVLTRAQAEPMPDLFLRGAMGYSTEFMDTGQETEGRPPRTGLLANAQLGMTLPIFNRNAGGIASARTELLIAQKEVDRLKMQLRIQLASAVRDYNTALDAVTRYRETIIPRADEAHEMWKNKFSQMAAAYPQLLIANRTRYQVRQKYIASLVRLQQGSAQFEGFLLGGGLDTPRMGFDVGPEHAELTSLQNNAASEEGDISSLDEVHNVDHY